MGIRRKINATEVIEDVVNKTSSDKVMLRDLLAAMDAAGFGLAIMIFAFGIIIPIPPPYPSIVAVPLLIFSFQMMMGYDAPRLPKMFVNISISRSILATVAKKASPHITKIERFLKPRLTSMTSTTAERVIGLIIFIFAAFIALPLPFTNFVPGIGILIIAFGLLGRDGVFVLFGIFVGIVGVLMALTAIVLGVEAIHYIQNLF